MQVDNSRGRFARLPLEVLKDRELTPADIVVYAALALEVRKENSNVVARFMREIAATTNLSLRQVFRSIQKLSLQRHISTAVARLNHRSTFVLLSPVFQPKQAKVLSMPKRLRTAT